MYIDCSHPQNLEFNSLQPSAPAYIIIPLLRVKHDKLVNILECLTLLKPPNLNKSAIVDRKTGLTADWNDIWWIWWSISLLCNILLAMVWTSLIHYQTKNTVPKLSEIHDISSYVYSRSIWIVAPIQFPFPSFQHPPLPPSCGAVHQRFQWKDGGESKYKTVWCSGSV